jgi:hypothetical protein
MKVINNCVDFVFEKVIGIDEEDKEKISKSSPNTSSQNFIIDPDKKDQIVLNPSGRLPLHSDSVVGHRRNLSDNTNRLILPINPGHGELPGSFVFGQGAKKSNNDSPSDEHSSPQLSPEFGPKHSRRPFNKIDINLKKIFQKSIERSRLSSSMNNSFGIDKSHDHDKDMSKDKITNAPILKQIYNRTNTKTNTKINKIAIQSTKHVNIRNRLKEADKAERKSLFSNDKHNLSNDAEYVDALTNPIFIN